jgi:hypothetical protein
MLAQLTRTLAENVLDAMRACSVSELLGSLNDGPSPSPTPATVLSRAKARRLPSPKRAVRSKAHVVLEPVHVEPLRGEASHEADAAEEPKPVHAEEETAAP